MADLSSQQKSLRQPCGNLQEVTPQTAGAQVLHTTELLEAILLELDMQTLLLIQRVSRLWYDLIKASTPLQKKLWFIPDDDFQAQQLGRENHWTLGSFNWFLCDKLFRINGECKDPNRVLLDMNFVLIDEITRHGRLLPYPVPGSDDDATVVEAYVTFPKSVRKSGTGTGSWRKMLLHQSPHQAIHWDVNISHEPPMYIFSKQGCVGRRRPTKFYHPKILAQSPTMEFLLESAEKKRNTWLKGRKEQPILERIREDKVGRPRYIFTSDFQYHVLIGTIATLASPILIPIGIYCYSRDKVRTYRRMKKIPARS